MAILGFILGVLTTGMVYWLFIREKNQQKWYTRILAIALIAWTIFAVSFVGTSIIEGVPQAAAVALLFFGIGEIILFVLLKRFTGSLKIQGTKSAQIAG